MGLNFRSEIAVIVGTGVGGILLGFILASLLCCLCCVSRADPQYRKYAEPPVRAPQGAVQPTSQPGIQQTISQAF